MVSDKWPVQQLHNCWDSADLWFSNACGNKFVSNAYVGIMSLHCIGEMYVVYVCIILTAGLAKTHPSAQAAGQAHRLVYLYHDYHELPTRFVTSLIQTYRYIPPMVSSVLGQWAKPTI